MLVVREEQAEQRAPSARHGQCGPRGYGRQWERPPGEEKGQMNPDEPFKGRKRFGYRVRQARARPSNTSIRDLLSNDRYTEADLEFLRDTRVGEVKTESLRT